MGITQIIGCIRSAMYQQKVTQIEMAGVLQIDRRTLSSKFRYERFSIAEIVKMCDRLNLEIFIIPKEV